MAGFDLSALLGDVSQFGHERKQIEYIPLANIISDERNRYELSGIEELAANIEMFGLQQPLEVRPDPDREGEYIITSGHRRKAALELLEMDEAPCIVVAACESPALQELRLIFANSDTRKMSPAEQAWQAERIEALLYELKEQGYDFPGRMRDHVAAITGMSRSKLARLSVIRNNLKPEGLMKAFEEGRLNESVAYEIARRSPEAQELADEQVELLPRLNAGEMMVLMDKLEKEAEEDKRLAANMKAAAEKLKASAEPVKKPPQAVQDYLEQREAEDLEFRECLGKLVEVGAIGLPVWYGSRKLSIDGLKALLRYRGGGNCDAHYSGSGSGLTVRKFGRADIMRSWTDAYDALCGIALERQRKACPNSDTEKKWNKGLPERDCLVAGRFDCGGAVVISAARFVAETQTFIFYKTGIPLDAECVGWVELPEEE